MTKKVKWLYILALFVLFSCTSNTKKAKTNNNHTIEKVTTTTKDSLSLEKLMLLTKEEAIDTYGIPSTIERFILHDGHGEFRNNITNKYNLKERLSESITIDEATWEKDQETWITVWYEVQEAKSIPKEAYVWEKGSEF